MGKPIGADVSSELAQLGARASGNGRRRGRILEAEQLRTFELLRGVPGLNEADARDLATVATTADFEAALKIMTADVRKPGGWLRAAVKRGWARPALGTAADGPEAARG